MTWSADLPEGWEADKVKHVIVPYTRGRVLDLGCGPNKAWPHFLGVDNREEWTGIDWKPDIEADVTDLALFADGSMDAVFSSHLLEHLTDPAGALREWWRVIKTGGHLVLYLPHRLFYPNIGEPGHNPDHKHDFVPADVIETMRRVGGWDLVENQDRIAGDEYSFLLVFRKVPGRHHSATWAERKADGRPTCLVIRYGGFGDHIMASSILPHLRKQGFRVVYETTTRGHDIMRDDPHIDEFRVLDPDQVPNEQLGPYWQALGREYDKVVNLSESVEGALLAIPGRRNHAMPAPARRLLMGLNYLELTHALAGVPYQPKARFHPSARETADAVKFRESLGRDAFAVLWTLSGSSVHKTFPWVDHVIAWLMQYQPNVRVVLTGDKACQMLERAIAEVLVRRECPEFEVTSETKLSDILLRLKTRWGKNRLICTSGTWSIRQTLAFVEHADCLVGPETGVMNAGSFLDVPKVCLLSHSSHENLTRDWIATEALKPAQSVACYPCHRMHYTRDYCPTDRFTGAAACAASITPESVYEAIGRAMRRRAAA